jgi:catechol 2,3-dioxygenase-like lactoylglutathione lyase family enzyme
LPLSLALLLVAVYAPAMQSPGFCVFGLDHVQLAIPPGSEDRARAFYVGVLGLREVPKPDSLTGRGGAWLVGGSVKLHLGVEEDFRPARKAHPALLVDGLDELERRCIAAGGEVSRDVPLEGFRRLHIFDPFGNRIELLERD